VIRCPSARLAANRLGPGIRRAKNDVGAVLGGVNAVLQAVTQVDQGKQELSLGLAPARRGMLARAVEVALQTFAVLAQVVAETPQLIERILELPGLQPQFILQHRHLAEQGGEIDRRRLALAGLVSRRRRTIHPFEAGAELVDQPFSFFAVERYRRRHHFAPSTRSSCCSLG
jgi:hypothetical protein